MKTRLRDSDPYWVGSRRGSPVWGVLRFVECVETEPKGRCCVLMLGKCARVRSPSQKQSDLCLDTEDQMVWKCVGCASSRLYLLLPQKADKVHKWRWVTAWLCFMRRASAKRAETCCYWSNVASHFHRCLSVRQPLLLPARQPRLLCCNWTTDPGTRDPRPPFLCEVAPDTGPVISRT